MVDLCGIMNSRRIPHGVDQRSVCFAGLMKSSERRAVTWRQQCTLLLSRPSLAWMLPVCLINCTHVKLHVLYWEAAQLSHKMEVFFLRHLLVNQYLAAD